MRNCCYVAVCSAARCVSAPTAGRRGAGAYRGGRPPTDCLFSPQCSSRRIQRHAVVACGSSRSRNMVALQSNRSRIIVVTTASSWVRHQLFTSSLTRSHQVLLRRPICLVPSTSIVLRLYSQSESRGFRSRRADVTGSDDPFRSQESPWSKKQ